MMKSKKSLVLGLIVCIAVVAIGSWYFYTGRTAYEQVIDFNDARDTQDILDIFQRDWYWLIASEKYSPEFMLKYRAPTQDISSAGQLHIKVMRTDDKLIGFTAYYMKTPISGWVLFVDVNPQFRGKGYADQLLQYAIAALKKMGARSIHLLTRTTNISAQKLYKRNRLQEDYKCDGFIFFKKQLI